MNIIVFNDQDKNDKFYATLKSRLECNIHFMNELEEYKTYKSKGLSIDVSIVVNDLTFFMNVKLEGVVYLRVKPSVTTPIVHLDQTFMYNIVMNTHLAGIIVPTETDLYSFCDKKFFFLKSRRNKNGNCMVLHLENEDEVVHRFKSDIYDFRNRENIFYHAISSKNIPIQTYVINLERKTDRKKEMIDKVDYMLHDIEFFKAVEGRGNNVANETIFRLTEQYLFKKKNPYGYISKNGEFGCALSHYFVWKDIVKKVEDGIYDENQVICVFEDDINFTTRYIEKLMKVLSSLSVSEWKFCFLGHTDDIPGIDKITPAFDENVSLVRINGHSKRTHAGGSFAYLINYKGALAFLNCVDKYGISQAIDWFLFEMADEIEMYKTYPHLVVSEVNSIDTDIQ